MRATRFRQIFTLIILLVFVLIVLYYNLIFTKSKTVNDRNKEEFKYPIFKVEKPLNLTFDEYCDEYGEWETIGRDYYFKRESVFYFVDANFFRINYMSDVKRSFNFEIKVKIKYLDSLYEETIKNGLKWKSSWSGKTFRFSSLDVPFNLSQIIRDVNMKHLTISILIHDIEKQTWTKNELKAKCKLLKSDFDKKKSSMVCSKCLYLNNKDHFKSFQWWLEINLRAGYEKLYFCNHFSDETFQELFKKYESFLIIGSMKCLPNLLADPSLAKYFNSYTELGKEFILFEIMCQLIVNECYLENIDKYKYITVVDNDEVIIPQVLEKKELLSIQEYLNTVSMDHKKNFQDLKCVQQGSNSTDLESYIDLLTTKLNVRRPRSFYFKQGFFINNILLNNIIDHIEVFLSNTTLTNNQSIYNYQIEIKEHKIPNGLTNQAFIFKIESKFDYDYAKALVYLNKEILQPYLRTYGHLIEKYAQNVDRFVMISGRVNDFVYAKSTHDTRRSFDLTVHHPLDYIDKLAIYYDNNYLDENKAEYYSVDYNYGHLAHFRSHFSFTLPPMPITFLNFDLNYFNCYFRPILKNLSENYDV